ncbi:MAG: hypothetical protein GX653_03635 [Clostridiales bacterium]|nr:hypothetical protein [Clostridiales bacterium]
MRAKMMLMSGDDQAKRLAFSVQGVLSDLAVAFGHSFLIKEEKISSASMADYGSPMTQEAVDASRDCDAVLCLTADHQGVVELAGGLGCHLCGHVYDLPEVLAAHALLKSNALPQGLIAVPIQMTPEALTHAAELLYTMARTAQRTLREIPATGKRRADWEAATGAASAAYSQTLPTRFTLGQGLDLVLGSPGDMGILFASPSAGEALHAAASQVSGLPLLLYDVYWDMNAARVYAARIREGDAPAGGNPFGVLYAAAHMLKHTLNLPREADCLLTSIRNVLDAGWRTPDLHAEDHAMHIDAEAICGLISEQIELAGTLMNFHP